MKILFSVTLLVFLLLLQPIRVVAHETDQFTLPVGREFADLRVYFSRVVRDAIVDALEDTNELIDASLQDGQPTEETIRLQSAEVIASKVYWAIFGDIPTNELLDLGLHREGMHERYPGLITAYRGEQTIYDHPALLLDLTKLVRTVLRASTVMVDGTLFGTDKLIHFLHLGRIYHASYLSDMKDGVDEANAKANAVNLSAGSNPFLSENSLLGILTTGIRSNADLAADYAGMQFFRNLTEDVSLNDRLVPSMLVRDGLYWRLAEHVNPYSDFFIQFITPHWNEVLNPNVFAVWTDTWVRNMIEDRCPETIDWYREEHGRVRDQRDFEAVARQLSTFFGEEYGYEDEGEETVSVATICFPSTVVHDDSESREMSMDAWDRTELWWAVKAGKHEEVVRRLAAGDDPNSVDLDGEGPLHLAARWGWIDITETLLAYGADMEARALYQTTPLHLAVRNLRSEVVRLLLTNGADPNARDAFGQSPLHEAALRGAHNIAALLLDSGGNPKVTSRSRTTPLHLAARSGDETMVKLLLSRGGDPKIPDYMGSTPYDEAIWGG